MEGSEDPGASSQRAIVVLHYDGETWEDAAALVGSRVTTWTILPRTPCTLEVAVRLDHPPKVRANLPAEACA